MNIITELQEMLHHNHAYVSIFKYFFEDIYLPDHNETVRTDMKPAREHECHYIAPSEDKVEIILINQQHGSKMSDDLKTFNGEVYPTSQ